MTLDTRHVKQLCLAAVDHQQIRMTVLLTSPVSVLLSALLMTAGSVVCGSPTDQDMMWSDHDPAWSLTDCCECIVVMILCSGIIVVIIQHHLTVL